MAASMRKCYFNILRYKKAYLTVCRRYTIEPPDWMGGKNILTRTGHYDFPKHSDTLEQRLTGMSATLHFNIT